MSRTRARLLFAAASAACPRHAPTSKLAAGLRAMARGPLDCVQVKVTLEPDSTLPGPACHHRQNRRGGLGIGVIVILPDAVYLGE